MGVLSGGIQTPILVNESDTKGHSCHVGGLENLFGCVFKWETLKRLVSICFLLQAILSPERVTIPFRASSR